MIKKVFTANVIYSTMNHDNIKHEDRVSVLNCKITQTEYGSVKIERPASPFIVELYPSKISHIIHYKE